ncbi:MAG: DUF4435 domain-containing protein [Muribaculaceae bacterium]|nr:DUF4435 domain-containing protein [Muribaculaceae bacterium]
MALSLTLPRSADGKRRQLPLCTQSLVIIGANGSGKSRFATTLAKNLGERAYRIGALHGIYGAGGKIADTPDIDRLLERLRRDEMDTLLAFKLRRTADAGATLEHTPLDSLISLWREIYPNHNILLDSTQFAFTRDDSTDDSPYSAGRLSDGERAVLYLIAAMLYAPAGAVVLVDSPEMFLHPTVMQSLWNRLEQLRPDCTMVYTTHDFEFASTRQGASVIWVRDYYPVNSQWDYEILPPGSPLSDEMYMSLIGARKPVLFIEGDGVRSIDSKLYPLIFKDYTVKSLGSCNKVIEATRTFNDLNTLHHMVSRGIVDRDRRDAGEVDYLRRKNILVPDVAEIENLLLLEEVVRAVASARGYNESTVARRVRQAVIKMFAAEYREQALMHTRHHVKRTVEYRIDGRFTDISQLEKHIAGLVDEIRPRRYYEDLCRQFKQYIADADYESILRVYNQKSMLPNSNVAGLVGLHNKEAYIAQIIALLKADGRPAERIRKAVTGALHLPDDAG